jgi:hypothetical protein
VAVAVETGVPHTVWLDDPRALATAVEVLQERAEKMAKAQQKRRR